MAVIGYARVSTHEQNLDLQRNALTQAGCDLVFEDLGISATARRRPGFEQVMSTLRQGDIFVTWKMDRAFRSLRCAINVLDEFEQRGIEFKCLTEAIDTTTPMGKCMYQVRNAFAELERNFIRERTIAGMQAARQRGAKIGRPRKLTDKQVKHIRHCLSNKPDVTRAQIARELGISPQTLRRALNQS